MSRKGWPVRLARNCAGGARAGGSVPVDARSDQFAFAVTLWEALYGRRPFDALSLPELASRVLAGDHHEGVQPYEHEARFGLAQLLVETGGDGVRARALAQAARDGYAALGEGKAGSVAEVEAWLAGAPRAAADPTP